MIGIVAALALSPLQTTVPKIGLSFGVKETFQEADFLQSLREQVRLGVDGFYTSLSWNELSPDGKTIDLKKLKEQEGIFKFTGADGLLTLKTIDTVRTTIPAPLVGQGWRDLAPQIVPLWNAILDQCPKEMKWFSLGNEVDPYLAAQPQEVDGYLAFLETCRRAILAKRPDAKVGVTVTWEGLRKRPELARRLLAFGDVAILTYYPLNDDFSPMPPSEVPAHISRAIEAAGPKPVILQEIGYPAATMLGSSEQAQNDFVKAVFRELDRHPGKVLLANYFLQVDFAKPVLDMLETYYGLTNERFRAFLGTLGLKKSDGTPRAAWRTFQDEVRRRKPY